MNRPPHLGETPYFSIPPYVNLSELEQKLIEVGMGANSSIKKAIYQAELAHRRQRPRNSGAPVLEEHIYPVAMTVLEYQLYQKEIGNPEFAEISPEGVVVGLTHDTFDDGRMDAPTFRRLFGQRLFEFVWPLTDVCYWKAETYQEKIEMKFKKIETSPWQTWVAGLADRLNNSLCFYTPPYIGDNGQPTSVMKRQLTRDKNLVLPFAKEKSLEFFNIMFNELLSHYKTKYPLLRNI